MNEEKNDSKSKQKNYELEYSTSNVVSEPNKLMFAKSEAVQLLDEHQGFEKQSRSIAPLPDSAQNPYLKGKNVTPEKSPSIMDLPVSLGKSYSQNNQYPEPEYASPITGQN